MLIVSLCSSSRSRCPARTDLQKVLYDISCLPLRCETISRQKAKADLDAKLQEIEKALALFGRKRVLIQL
jgi:hypothetical protein